MNKTILASLDLLLHPTVMSYPIYREYRYVSVCQELRYWSIIA
jgi:hypothetical protein